MYCRQLFPLQINGGKSVLQVASLYLVTDRNAELCFKIQAISLNIDYRKNMYCFDLKQQQLTINTEKIKKTGTFSGPSNFLFWYINLFFVLSLNVFSIRVNVIHLYPEENVQTMI